MKKIKLLYKAEMNDIKIQPKLDKISKLQWKC